MSALEMAAMAVEGCYENSDDFPCHTKVARTVLMAVRNAPDDRRVKSAVRSRGLSYLRTKDGFVDMIDAILSAADK